VSEKNQEIGDYIDQRDADIDDYAKQLRTLLKQRKEMKFRIEEAKGTIAGMQMEKEKYQFERIKFEMDSESDSQEGSKEQIMTQLEHRLREANDSYRRLNNLIKDGPPTEMSLPNMSVEGGRGAMWQNQIDELHELLKEKQNLENEIRGDIRSLQSKLSGESSRLP